MQASFASSIHSGTLAKAPMPTFTAGPIMTSPTR